MAGRTGGGNRGYHTDSCFSLQTALIIFITRSKSFGVSTAIVSESISLTICATLKTPYRNPVDVINKTTPKVVTDLDDNILLFTSPIL